MKLLILINDIGGLYNFRKELITSMKSLGHEIVVVAPDGEYREDIILLGARYIDVPFNRRSTNLREEICLLKNYISIIRQEKPTKVISYTIKPNIYGGLACRICSVKYITAIVGLGSVYINNSKIKPLIMTMTRIALKKSETVFFLNQDNKEFYIKNNLLRKGQHTVVVHGSGVDTEHFYYSKQEDKPDVFLFVGRLFRDKGIYELLEAAKLVKEKYEKVSFEIVGFTEDEETSQVIEEAINDKIIIFHGKQKNVIPYMRNSTCVVLPSYGEGCGTVLQEGASIGRPLIACDTFGCRDNIVEGENGFLCEVANSTSLFKAIEKMINLSYDDKVKMGMNSRIKAENEFERKEIIDTYIRAILN